MKKNGPARIGMIDYGMGNLHSAGKALSLAGGDVTVSDTATRLAESDVLVLPGVGAFGAAMKNLAEKRLDDFVRRWIADGRPYLGICLGLQLLFETSAEDPGVPGLGALKGTVMGFRKEDFQDEPAVIPHMGWNTLERRRGDADALFEGVSAEDRVYFVHSYYAVPADRSIVAATTTYGVPFCSVAAQGRVFACQFHPEKSGAVGQRILRNAVAWLGDRTRAGALS